MSGLRWVVVAFLCIWTVTCPAKKRAFPWVEVDLKSGGIVQGLLVKDWNTPVQADMETEHHIVVRTSQGKMRLKASVVDSLCILTSAGAYKKGDVFVACKQVGDGNRQTSKFCKKIAQGHSLLLCVVIYRRGARLDYLEKANKQYMRLYLVIFDKVKAVPFLEEPITAGAARKRVELRNFIRVVKTINPDLADEVKRRFCGRSGSGNIASNPRVLLDFCDEWLTQNNEDAHG